MLIEALLSLLYAVIDKSNTAPAEIFVGLAALNKLGWESGRLTELRGRALVYKYEKTDDCNAADNAM